MHCAAGTGLEAGLFVRPAPHQCRGSAGVQWIRQRSEQGSGAGERQRRASKPLSEPFGWRACRGCARPLHHRLHRFNPQRDPCSLSNLSGCDMPPGMSSLSVQVHSAGCSSLPKGADRNGGRKMQEGATRWGEQSRVPRAWCSVTTYCVSSLWSRRHNFFKLDFISAVPVNLEQRPHPQHQTASCSG